MGIKLAHSGRFRFDDDDLCLQDAWREYRRALNDVGMRASEPVYRYFVGEAFHDSPIHIAFSLDLVDARDIKLNMRNIRLLDEIHSRFKVDIKRPDFQTDINFVNCHHVEFDFDLTKQHWCHGSAITKVNGLIEVVIATSSRIPDDANLDEGIRIVAEEIHIEDISQRLSDRYGIDREEIEKLMADWHRTYDGVF